MGVTIKTDKDFPNLYKVYAPSPRRSEPKIGTLTEGDDGKWYFVPTLGVHAFDTEELSDLVRLTRGFARVTDRMDSRSPEQEYEDRLFIGGPWDGMWKSVPVNELHTVVPVMVAPDPYTVPIYDPPTQLYKECKVIHRRYVVHVFAVGEVRYRLMALESIELEDVFPMLLQGYVAKRKEEGH